MSTVLSTPTIDVTMPGGADHFGERLRSRLAEVAITPAELARRMEVLPQQVSNWLRRDLPPTEETLNRLSVQLETTPGWLRYGGDRQDEESAEEAVAVDWPETAYLKPKAQELYDRLIGQYAKRGWTQGTLAAAAHELTGFFRLESILNSAGLSRPDVSEEEQMIVLEAEARRIERAYGARGPAPRR